MPWFITAIPSEKEARFEGEQCRTFGFFEFYSSAREAIENNVGEMHEGLYEYLVLEYIEEGIFPTVTEAYWYRWDGKWISCNVPDKFLGVTNFAVG